VKVLQPLFADFLNSIWRDWRGSGRTEDRLEMPAWRKEFLDTWGFSQAVESPQPGELAALAELRSLLLRMVEALVAQEQLLDRDVDELNRFLARRPATHHLTKVEEGYRLEMLPAARDWNWVMTEIALSFARALAGDYRRIKICDNPDCRWVFYDESRNRTRRWCEDRYCGNLMKVRRFRARRRGLPGA
jgi:predicted RNA-binding Zn ribbon-like protein